MRPVGNIWYRQNCALARKFITLWLTSKHYLPPIALPAIMELIHSEVNKFSDINSLKVVLPLKLDMQECLIYGSTHSLKGYILTFKPQETTEWLSPLFLAQWLFRGFCLIILARKLLYLSFYPPKYCRSGQSSINASFTVKDIWHFQWFLKSSRFVVLCYLISGVLVLLALL